MIRDKQLDSFRAWLMVYIVCCIHVVYWWVQPNGALPSLLLFEMPSIFFIAGAASRLSAPKKMKELVINRCKRVVLPYYLYVGVSVFLITVISQIGHSLPFHYSMVTDYGIRDILHILLIDDFPRMPYAWHLWFIIPYMLVSISLPLQRRIAERWGTWYLLMLVILMGSANYVFSFYGISPVSFVGWKKIIINNMLYVLCYNVFFMAGFILYRRTNIRKTLTIGLYAFLLLLICTNFKQSNLQIEKFPPTIVFNLYGICALSVVSVLLRYITLPYPAIIAVWNRNGYIIYLYQNLTMWLFVTTVAPLFDSISVWLKIPLAIGCVFFLNTCIGLMPNIFNLLSNSLSDSVQDHLGGRK